MKQLSLKIILTLLLSIATVLFFKRLEELSLTLNSSWTFAKCLPYACTVLCGLLLVLAFKSHLKKIQNSLVRFLSSVLLLSFPFVCGFTLNPIYEGDFSNESVKTNVKTLLSEFEQTDFVMIGIPGCGFCMESTDKLNLLQQRNPNLKIKVLLCTTDQRQLKTFRSKLNTKINLAMPYNHRDVFGLANGKFPCFVKIDALAGTYTIWTNNHFGVRALDEVERLK